MNLPTRVIKTLFISPKRLDNDLTSVTPFCVVQVKREEQPEDVQKMPKRTSKDTNFRNHETELALMFFLPSKSNRILPQRSSR